MIHIHQFTSVTVLVFCLIMSFPAAGQEQTNDTQTMDKLKKLLEDKNKSSESSEASSDPAGEQDEDLEALKEANRELHGGSSPEAREKKNPTKILDEIIDKMDTAARSLETNVRKLNVIQQKLKQIQINGDQNPQASEKQKQILEEIKSILNDSKDQQKSASKQFKELLSFKEQVSKVKSAQKQSLNNIDQLLKIARKRSSSSGSGSGRKRKRKQNQQSNNQKKKPSEGNKQQQRANKPKQQRQSKNQPADEPYEDSSTPPEQIKSHSQGGSSSWGELPEKVRKAILQRRNEDFVPSYGERLRQYYKKLGEDSSRQ